MPHEVPHNHLVNRTMLDSARDLFSRSAMSEANYQADPELHGGLGMKAMRTMSECQVKTPLQSSQISLVRRTCLL